eukprot:5716018-Prymnesium_polylepis.1
MWMCACVHSKAYAGSTRGHVHLFSTQEQACTDQPALVTAPRAWAVGVAGPWPWLFEHLLRDTDGPVFLMDMETAMFALVELSSLLSTAIKQCVCEVER